MLPSTSAERRKKRDKAADSTFSRFLGLEFLDFSLRCWTKRDTMCEVMRVCVSVKEREREREGEGERERERDSE